MDANESVTLEYDYNSTVTDSDEVLVQVTAEPGDSTAKIKLYDEADLGALAFRSRGLPPSHRGVWVAVPFASGRITGQ